MEERDIVKKRMGTENWKNNPNPRNDYAEKRRAAEEMLRNVTEALVTIEPLDFSVFGQSDPFK